jgi:hypothetical protein
MTYTEQCLIELTWANTHNVRSRGPLNSYRHLIEFFRYVEALEARVRKIEYVTNCGFLVDAEDDEEKPQFKRPASDTLSDWLEVLQPGQIICKEEWRKEDGEMLRLNEVRKVDGAIQYRIIGDRSFEDWGPYRPSEYHLGPDSTGWKPLKELLRR